MDISKEETRVLVERISLLQNEVEKAYKRGFNAGADALRKALMENLEKKKTEAI